MKLSAPKYKDRGWWLCFDVDKSRHHRKKLFPRVISLLSEGNCYELLYDDGNSAIRGIFDRQTQHLKPMIELLRITNAWSGIGVYVKGVRLNSTQKCLMERMLACVRADAQCRNQDKKNRYLFMGCHLQGCRIGLTGFSPSLFNGDPYWFSFFKQSAKERNLFFLDYLGLKNAIEGLSLCPLFPAGTWEILESLPKQINFNRLSDIEMWLPACSVSWAKGKKHFSAVLPRKPDGFNKWLLDYINTRPRAGGDDAYKHGH